LADGGIAYWDNEIFRGLKGRVLVIKRSGGYEAAQDQNCGFCSFVDCIYHSPYKEKHTNMERVAHLNIKKA